MVTPLQKCYDEISILKEELKKRDEQIEKLIENNINLIIIKFRYNARSDWLKDRALSEYRARSVEKWRTNCASTF